MANTPIKHSSRNAEIKQNLFRFVHIKDVKVSTDERDEHYRNIVADSEESNFLKTTKDIEDSVLRKTEIDRLIEEFSPYSSFKEANAIDSSITDFSHWLKSNKSKLKLQNIQAEIEGISNYSEEDKVLLWDNLFYFTLTNKSPIIRDTILSLIKADHFILKFNEFSDEYRSERFTKNEKRKIDKVVKANVMIPSYLFPKESSTATTINRDSSGDKNLLKFIEKGILKQEILILKGFQKELKKGERVYRQEDSKAFQIAKNQFNALAKTAVERATKVVDPDNQTVTYEGLDLPEFKYTSKDIFDAEFLKANFSINAQKMFNLNYKNRSKTLSEIEQDLKTRIERKTKQLLNIKIVRNNTVIHNGSKIEASYMPTVPKIITKEIADFYETEKNSLYLTLFYPNSEELINEMTVSIDLGKKLVGELINEEKNIYTYKFTNDAGAFAGNNETILTGNFKNSRNENFSFGKKGFVFGDNYDFLCVLKSGDTCYVDRETGTWGCIGIDGLPYSPTVELLKTSGCFRELEEFDGEPGSVLSPIYGLKKIGIAEFKRVEQELCCYVEGEVSHIENILAREYKEKSTRSLTRSETTTEESEEIETESLTDTTTTDRHEMQQEVAKVLEKSKELSYGASTSFEASYGGTMTIGGDAYIDGSSSSSSSSSFSQSESFAKEVVERAMERVVKKSSYKRTTRMLREFEENNKHGFDNRKGAKHVTGIYRWVDKIYNNKLVNYGKRLIYEFSIPEPAKNWKDLIAETAKTTPGKPEFNEDFLSEVSGWEDINSTNYANLSAAIEADVEPYPDSSIRISKSFAEKFEGVKDLETESAKSFELEIPEGYYCEYVSYNWGYIHHGKNFTGLRGTAFPGFYPEISIGSRLDIGVPSPLGTSSGQSPFPSICIDKVEKFLPISFNAKDVASIKLNITAICELKTSTLQNWQRQAYSSILQAYNRKHQEYKEALIQWEIQENAINGSEITDYNNNPLKNRKIEQTELKKIAIQYMLSQSNQSIGQNFRYDSTSNCSSGISMSQGLNDYSEIIRFFEEAVDWNLMSYTFHPYFWADCKTDNHWQELLKSTSKSDPLFETFLQSGFANMKIPVKGGFEAAILFFLDTGRIWKEGDVAIDDENGVYNASLLNLDLRSPDTDCCDCTDDGNKDGEGDCECGDEEELCIEAKWTSRIPTTLTIVQDYAAPIEGNGLPCFSKEDKKIKFCEDGTPLGGLNSDQIDQNEGVMVGLDNDDLAYSCTIMLSNQATLVEAATAIIASVTDFEGDNSESVNQLQEILDTLRELFANGEANGCNVVPVQESIDTVIALIGSIS